MTVNQRRKRKRGETRSRHKMVTINLHDMYYAYSRPMIFVVNRVDPVKWNDPVAYPVCPIEYTTLDKMKELYPDAPRTFLPNGH